MKGININKLIKEKKFVKTSTKEALKDVTPINWSKKVLEGKQKIEVDFMKN